ncbi:MAG: glycoside hydrolase family 130 protein [Oscillospiraceae bacterium]|jgi:beta-1,4-mannooligosaccharide/beta-1,4-mannosyl-N-acetylglucosamine phosphorylase|nr:glycoside hydrolase family 130 protein [Oscillospiraceae bacterium]
MKVKIIGEKALPNMPWEEKPKDSNEVIWRYSKNPVIRRNHIPCSNSIFNSAVVPFEDGYAGVFRADDKSRNMNIHAGFSKDALNWDINPERIKFKTDIPEMAAFQYGYDPRVCFIEDRYYVTWCNSYKYKPTIGVAYTYDFKEFTQIENAYLPFNRNGVMFPRKIGGNFMMMSRPSDSGHTPFGDIYISQSPDMTYWGKHRHVMGPSRGWESTKIGAGPIPIETDRGWLMFYHGVLTSCNGFVYSFSAALLDIDEPWKVLKRGNEYLLSPQELYEIAGDVPNVVFPCANLVDADTGRIAIYYGCADTHTGICFTTADDVIDYLDNNSQV